MEALQKYAYHYLEQGKIDVSLESAKKILELVPDDHRGLFLAGQCYMAKRDDEKAEAYFRKGIKAAKEDAAMYVELAFVEDRLGKRNEAINVLTEGLKATRGTSGGMQILWRLTNYQIVAGEFSLTQKGIKELRENGYPPPLIDYLDARLRAGVRIGRRPNASCWRASFPCR